MSTLYFFSLTLTLVTLSMSLDNRHIFVIKTEGTECPIQHCYTITEFIDEFLEPYSNLILLNSSTTIHLLPGVHNVTHNRPISQFWLEDLQNVFVTGTHNVKSNTTSESSNNSTIIHCTSAFGLAFGNITNLTVKDIAFKNCSSILDTTYFEISTAITLENPTILLLDSFNITVSNIIISEGRGVGIVAYNTFNLALNNASMTINYINVYILIDTRFRHMRPTNSTYINVVNSTFFGTEQVYGYVSGIGIDIRIHAESFQVNFQLGNSTLHNRNLYHRLLDCPYQRTISPLTVWIHDTKFISDINCKDCSGLSLDVRDGNKCVYTTTTLSNTTFIHASLLAYSTLLDGIHVLNIIDTYFENIQSTPMFFTNMLQVFLQNVIVTKSFSILGVVTSVITFEQQNVFSNNEGGLIAVDESELIFGEDSNVTLTGNKCTSDIFMKQFRFFQSGQGGSPLFIQDSKLLLSRHSNIVLKSNYAKYSGGLTLLNSTIQTATTTSFITFIDNEGSNGGGIAMYEGSLLFFRAINITFISNRARQNGGALFVDDAGYIDHLKRTFSKQIFSPCECEAYWLHLNFTFINNTASFAGSEIYGGWINWGHTPRDIELSNNPLSQHSFHQNQNRDPSKVTSNPSRVCLCLNSTVNCSITIHPIQVYHGQTFEIEAVAVGQQFGTVPATIRAEFTSANTTSTGTVESVQYLQTVTKYCTPLEYTVLSLRQTETLTLSTTARDVPNILEYARRDVLPMAILLFHQLSIEVELKPCPLGFTFSQRICICQPTLQKHTVECDMDNFTILRPRQKWINVTFTNNTPNSKQSEPGIIIHDHCPFDYCKSDIPISSLNLEYPDQQCAFSRSDILCGNCQTNYSHIFGTSRCKICSSLWVLLILPVVIIAGIALVVFLMVLNMTVALGTINGLIFYANIVRANHTIFFPYNISNSFLSWFIAWLNLDLGIEVCFYDGLTAYVKTWLQFIFPFYIWLMVTTIIVSSHYSVTATRLSGDNAVQVLSTLFLLSYTKILRLIITVLQPTTLTYPDGYNRKVWLYDGNVDYFKGKHIPLFLTAVVFLILLSVPFTTTLFGIQWLRKHKKYAQALFWIRKLQPIFDAYTGPYKDKHRYWTGLLLFVRVGLLVVFSLNTSGNPSVNLLAVSITVFALLGYLSFIGGIYKSWPLNLLEIVFILNLGILSVATQFQVTTTARITFQSTGLAFALFISIVLYHVLLRARSTKRGAEIYSSLKSKVAALIPKAKQTVHLRKEVTHTASSHVTRQYIDLRESLLVSGEVQEYKE